MKTLIHFVVHRLISRGHKVIIAGRKLPRSGSFSVLCSVLEGAVPVPAAVRGDTSQSSESLPLT